MSALSNAQTVIWTKAQTREMNCILHYFLWLYENDHTVYQKNCQKTTGIKTRKKKQGRAEWGKKESYSTRGDLGIIMCLCVCGGGSNEGGKLKCGLNWQTIWPVEYMENGKINAGFCSLKIQAEWRSLSGPLKPSTSVTLSSLSACRKYLLTAIHSGLSTGLVHLIKCPICGQPWTHFHHTFLSLKSQ